jgi:heme/copper-type cytochrome/quinol oxidase subunit 3
VGDTTLFVDSGMLYPGFATTGEQARNTSRCVGRVSLSWHALDIIWVALLTLVYLTGLQE